MGRPFTSSVICTSTERLRENLKLTDYPLLVQTYGKKISMVGIATRGCRVTYDLSLQCRQLGNFLYLSCDESDLVNIPATPSSKKIVFPLPFEGPRSPSCVRGIVALQLEQIRKVLSGSQVVFLVCGLGGAIGSGIAPLVARCAKQVRAMVVGVVSMPFVFEKHKHFFAGCALRQLAQYCDGIIMLEQEEILRTNDLSMFDANALVCEKLSLAINELVGPIEKDGTGSGVERVVDYIRANPYSVLRITDDLPRGDVISEEKSTNQSAVLVSHHSKEDVDVVINSYDPVDACLRKSSSSGFMQNLDPEYDTSFEFGQGILRNIEG